MTIRFYRQHDTPYSLASGTGHGFRMAHSTVEEFREGVGEGMDTVSGAEVPAALATPGMIDAGLIAALRWLGPVSDVQMVRAQVEATWLAMERVRRNG